MTKYERESRKLYRLKKVRWAAECESRLRAVKIPPPEKYDIETSRPFVRAKTLADMSMYNDGCARAYEHIKNLLARWDERSLSSPGIQLTLPEIHALEFAANVVLKKG